MPGSPTVVILMAVIALAVATLFVVGVWRATRSARTTFLVGFALSLLMTAQHFMAVSGALHDFNRFPPPFGLMVLGMLAITIAFAFSKTGAQLARDTSLTALVASQVFRFPLELTMHKAATEGVMPMQMSYSAATSTSSPEPPRSSSAFCSRRAKFRSPWFDCGTQRDSCCW